MDEGLSPSSKLLDFPLLAILTNDFLNSFNELRHCVALTLLCDLSEEMAIQMEEIALAISSSAKRFDSVEMWESGKKVDLLLSLSLIFSLLVFANQYRCDHRSLQPTSFHLSEDALPTFSTQERMIPSRWKESSRVSSTKQTTELSISLLNLSLESLSNA